jgi:hypothetical protein
MPSQIAVYEPTAWCEELLGNDFNLLRCQLFENFPSVMFSPADGRKKFRWLLSTYQHLSNVTCTIVNSETDKESMVAVDDDHLTIGFAWKNMLVESGMTREKSWRGEGAE